MTRRFSRALVVGLLFAACVVAPSPATAGTTAAPTRIMALGDSITGSPGCWRALLWQHLQATGHTDVDFVGTLPAQGCGFTYDGENEGHGGFLATGIVRDNQLPGWLSASRPDIVLMHLGTNDVWNGIAASTILDAYTTLLGQLRASNPATKLVVAKIIPMNPANCAACAQRVVDLNNAIPAWAQAHSTAASPITVADQWTGFDTAADTTDGVHPNSTTGIQKMESRWYPALVAALPGSTAVAGLHVSGTQVAEANGAAFVMRGVNHPYAWYPSQTGAFADIKSFGANTVRVVLGSGQRWGPTSAAEVATVVSLCKQSRLICVLEAHDTTGYGEEGAAASLDQAASYWISVASALKGQENYVVINLGNEPFGNNQQVSATWASATSAAITRLRGAGLTHLLMADAPMWGQDWQNIMRDNAASVLSADPQHNTVFSLHMYGVYDTAAEITGYFDAFRTAGLPLVVGEFGNMHTDGNPDEDTIMAQAQARGLGYLGWSWSGNSSDVAYLDLVNNFDPASLTAWGERFLNGTNGVRQTSKEATIYGGGTADTVAPTTPGTPSASAVTSTGATLSWSASTDNVGVTGYDVLRATGSGTFSQVGTTGTTTFTDTGLTASTTYRYQVRARDAAGNVSANSSAATVTTAAGGTGTCRIGYSAPAWGGGTGFTASVTITNTGAGTLTGWSLAFTYADGQRVTLPGWGATFTQTGGAVTATNLSWNGTLAPNASTGIGFNGTFTGANPAPASFTLNGSPCTTAPTFDKLSRGVVSVHTAAGNRVGWRLLADDPAGVAFAVYRDGTRVTETPAGGPTGFLDAGAPAGANYTVRAVVGGVERMSAFAAEKSLTLDSTAAASTRDVPIQIPPGGTTPSGESYTYAANDASVGDLDGDGQYEIVLKWDPSNAKDNSQSGYTGDVYVDAYRLDGTRLWRIDLGRNIRAGAHYTQFQVFDYDGDGRAEVAMKTADGTRSGTGQVIGSSSADYRNSGGYVLSGPEYLTMFNGQTGAATATVNYDPPRGTVSSWGDSYGNRVDRFLAGTAYLDGSHPSLIMSRGYYTRTVIAAWDFRGGALTERWKFDSNSAGSQYTGQGDHQLAIADADGDGRDEIVFGAMAVDDNGSPLWNIRLGHGDAMHVGDLIPSRAGLEEFKVDEDTSKPAAWMADAKTGQIIWQNPSCSCDNGRGVSDDIYAGSPGAESWSSAVSGLLNTSGQNIGRKPSSTNFVLWWDGDAQRELLDGTHIDKYGTSADTRLLTASGVHANNGTKNTPSLQADLFGDWREEVVWPTSDNRALRIYSTTDATSISHVSLMQDRQYREAVAWQNTAYNQPPHPSFALAR